jgi:glycerol-3-phosphate dehydrogenase (NAD(P)+)
MDREALLNRSRTRGVNMVVYWIARAILQPFFHLWFRMARTGREHIPADGPLILAANHRSFLDPFVIGMMTRRPLHFVAKRELFTNRLTAWFLNSLGAFPIERGNGDEGAMATARAILERGGAVLIFPEGTRIRPGGVGHPKRGVGRLALETGAPVVPIAIHGTEDVRRGWRIRPRRVSVRAGRALTFPHVATPSPALAGAVTARIWPCVELQWEWLGGLPRLRRVAIVGASARGDALGSALARAGVDVDRSATARDLYVEHQDLVVLATAPSAIPDATAGLEGRLPSQAGVLVLTEGLVELPAEPPPPAPFAHLPNVTALPLPFLRRQAAAAQGPAEYVNRRIGPRVACLGRPVAGAHEAFGEGAVVVVASQDRDLVAQLADTLATAGLDVQRTNDVAGVELAALGGHESATATAQAG